MHAIIASLRDGVGLCSNSYMAVTLTTGEPPADTLNL